MMVDNEKTVDQEWDDLKKKYPDAVEVNVFMPFEDSRKEDLETILELLTDDEKTVGSDHKHEWVIHGNHHDGCHAYCQVKGCDEELEHDELERRVNSFEENIDDETKNEIPPKERREDVEHPDPSP